MTGGEIEAHPRQSVAYWRGQASTAGVERDELRACLELILARATRPGYGEPDDRALKIATIARKALGVEQ